MTRPLLTVVGMTPPVTYRDTWMPQWACGYSIQPIIPSVHRVYKFINVYAYDNTVLPLSTRSHIPQTRFTR